MPEDRDGVNALAVLVLVAMAVLALLLAFGGPALVHWIVETI